MMQAAVAPMDRLRARRLAEFVDRSAEMSSFVDVLDTGEPPIMVVSAESGMGKTSLLMRMVHESSLRSLRRAEIVWSDTNVYDYMTVMRRMRDDLGAEHFGAFTDLVNYYTDANYQPRLDINVNLQGGTIDVAKAAQISGSSVGDMAGVILRDNMIVYHRSDIAVPIEVRREQLTARFLEGLAGLSKDETIVLFFDAIEKMSDLTHQWLWDQLLKPVVAGALPGVRAVVLGQRPLPADRDLAAFVKGVRLEPLGRDDIDAYIAKRADGMGLSDSTRMELATLLAAMTRGRPTDVASAVDLYLASRAKA
ncbi:AAA family ATPase [Variovorax sp. J22P271]|uniref:AAA family ATPase n=1 Tax=Variovorax davisae TaxID=3053515 RepID=UPI0025780FB1|nr:AAA family ATPase [Variovorax sp. J22P271]MDM0032828.1 AAA family ATPase [Variovorax sp. J22P271]